MEGVKTSRFPQIGEGFHVGGITAERESPERSWARIRTYLIDNPKDDGLIRRQEIWNYQNRNRGVIKSMLKTVPNIPYRVKRQNMDKVSELNAQDGNSLVLPKLQKFDATQGRVKIRGVFSPPSRPRPLGYTKDFDSKRKEIRKQIQKFESAAKFLGKPTPTEDFSNVKQYDHAKNTLQTISRKFPKLPDQHRKKSIPMSSNLNPQKRNVSFSLNDLRSDDIRNVSRCSSSSSSVSSAYSDSVLGNYDGNYGPSSHNFADNSKYSVYDYLNRNICGDVRTLDMNTHINTNLRPQIKKNQNEVKTSTERKWFEEVLEDKEIFNMSEYDNYARIKPPGENTRNMNVLGQVQSKVQSVPGGRQNLEIQNKAGNRQAVDTQVRSVQNPAGTRSLHDNQLRNVQNMSNSKPVSEVNYQGQIVQHQDNKSIQERPGQKQNINVSKASIYSQNQSKSVYPQNNTKHIQAKNNVLTPSASNQIQINSPVKPSEGRKVSNNCSPDSSPNELASRTPTEKNAISTGRQSVENGENPPRRLLYEKDASPTGRVSVEKRISPSISPIQKPHVKPLQNSTYRNMNDSSKNSKGVSQKLPFDVSRPMPRVPVKSSGYYPIFPSDGRPMRKIGKPKNSIAKIQSSSAQEILDKEENLKSQLPAICTLSDQNQLNTPVFI